jgi:PKD repeat protein
MTIRLVLFSMSLFVLLGVPRGRVEAAQPAPEIGLDPAIDCWFDSEFPVLGALVSPAEEIVLSRLYFRCSLYPDYYFVDLTSDGGTFRAVAPQADPTCPRVHYYVEALSRDFSSARTEERIAEVASPNECRRRNPGALWFTDGSDPGIVLGSLSGSGFAPGFKTVGIAGFLSSTGTTAAAGTSGGISGGAVAGIAAAGGAAAGLAVLSTGSGSSTTTSAPLVIPPPSTTTIPVTTTAPAAPQGVKACVRIDPPSGVAGVNVPFTFDGRCSEGDGLKFLYDLGDGRTREGQPFITAIWSQPGKYLVTLTVTSDSSSLTARVAEDSVSREITILEAPTAKFEARAVPPGPCTGEFDGTTSTGDISRYEWTLDPNNELKSGAIIVKGPIVSQSWKSCARDGTVLARLTVFGPDGASDTTEKRVYIETPSFITRAESAAAVETSLSSEMLDSENVRGQVVLEGSAAHAVSSEGPALVRYQGRAGRNVVEAVLASEAGSPVLWRFDFAGARGFVPGSLRALSGQEVARDAYSIVLRLSGSPGERARFEYRLEP